MKKAPAAASPDACVRAALCALALSATAVVAADAPPELLTKRVLALAGADSRDCGVASTPSERAAALACARAAAAGAGAWRVAVRLQDGDTFGWQGAQRDAHGRLSVVFYDADPDAGPSLSVVWCSSIAFGMHDDAIDCSPPVDGH